jgi:DNA-binding NtrC family response regulator
MHTTNTTDSTSIHILLVSSNTQTIDTIRLALKSYNHIQATKSESGQNALSKIKTEKFDLVIIDEILNDMSGLELAKAMISENPMINCAALSGLSPKKFHDASEGLGLLMQLPLLPQKSHIENLLSHLKRILDITIA